jgi:phosphoglucosamine mutase
MAESGAPIGGEPSGHVIFGTLSTTGDGILTALWVAALVARLNCPLSALADLPRTPQVLRNVRVERKVPIQEAAALEAQVSRARERLGERGRILLRYSGTEPLLRIMVEGSDAPVVEEIASVLAETAARELGAEA